MSEKLFIRKGEKYTLWEAGNKGYEHVQKNYSFENFEKQWADLMLSVHENYGSWGNRKNYQSWDLTEL